MPNRDYLPLREGEFDLWVQNYRSQIVGLAATVGLSPADVAAFEGVAEVWQDRFADFRANRASARVAGEQKDAARAALKDLVRRQVRRVQAAPGTTDAARAALQINARPAVRARVASPQETPLVRLYFGDRGRIRVHFGPNPANENANGLPRGAYGVVIEFAEGGVPTTTSDATHSGSQNGSAAVWAHLANRSASPYTHLVPNATEPRTFAYRCRYVNRRGDAGPWSAPVVGVVTP